MPINADENSTAVAKASYSGLFETRNHIQDLAARILTSAAFFTAAATAIFAQSSANLSENVRLWPRLFFGLYTLCVTAGAMFLLASMWPAIWNKVHGANNYVHTFSHPKNAAEYQNIEGIPSETIEEYRKELFVAYIRERDYILDDSEGITELLRVGGIFLIGAFFAFALLASTLFFDKTCIRWFFPSFAAAFFSAAMASGSFIRHYYTAKTYSPSFDYWWVIWIIVAGIMVVVTLLNTPPLSCA
jgi:hypothetical protein